MKKLVVLVLISVPLCAMQDDQEEDPLEELRRAVEGDHRSTRSKMATSGYTRASSDLPQGVMVEQVRGQCRRVLVIGPHFGLALQGNQKEIQALIGGKRVPLDTE